MAMTPLERKHLSLVRKKEREKLSGDLTDKIASRPFNSYLPDDGNWESDILFPLEWAGISPDAVPAFESDDDPEHDPDSDGPYRGSIGRAERMVGMLLDAASGLAGIINRYKRQELDRAIAEIEASDLSNPDKRKNALADIVRLTKLRDRLDKDVRRSIPQYELKGD